MICPICRKFGWIWIWIWSKAAGFYPVVIFLRLDESIKPGNLPLENYYFLPIDFLYSTKRQNHPKK